MAALVTQVVTVPPVVYSSAAGGGDTYAWTPTTFVHLRNGSGSAITATVAGQTPCSQGFLHNKAYTVPANGELFIEPLDGSLADGSSRVHLTYSAVTSLTLAAITFT